MFLICTYRPLKVSSLSINDFDTFFQADELNPLLQKVGWNIDT